MFFRKLEYKDAEYILEWMKDDECNRFFRFDSKKVDMDSINDFITNSWNHINAFTDYNLAIADENDIYMGTISLKNVNNTDRNAEIAISLRKKFQGKGIGEITLKHIISYAFRELHLNKVYLNVLSDNVRAIKLYEKIGMRCEGEFYNHILVNGEYRTIKWYGLCRCDECNREVDGDENITEQIRQAISAVSK